MGIGCWVFRKNSVYYLLHNQQECTDITITICLSIQTMVIRGGNQERSWFCGVHLYFGDVAWLEVLRLLLRRCLQSLRGCTVKGCPSVPPFGRCCGCCPSSFRSRKKCASSCGPPAALQISVTAMPTRRLRPDPHVWSHF